jgi:pantothenate kinase-related protein Tda10
MAGFRKAKAEQAALKIGMYGPPGSGKTFTSLLIAEGLSIASGKRVAYVDTERGTDFYCKDVPSRSIHPQCLRRSKTSTRRTMAS